MAAPNRPGRAGYWRLRLVGGVLLAAFSLWYVAGKVDRALFRLGVGTVEAVYGTVETRFSGRAVILRREHVVTAPLPGRVTLLVGEGRHVRAGDLIIEVDAGAEFGSSAWELEEVERRLAQSAVAYERERAMLLQRQGDLEMRLADARRVFGEALAQGDSQIAREAESRYNGFQRELAGIEQALAELIQREKNERDVLLRQRQSLLSLEPGDIALVRSPGPGVVSFSFDGLEGKAEPGADIKGLFEAATGRVRRTQDGARVAVDDPLFKVVEADRLEVAVLVQGAALDVGSRVMLDFQGIPERSFRGELVQSLALDGSFYARIRLDGFDSSLVHRRFSEVVITTDRKQGIVVPSTSIVERNGRRGVYLLLGDASVFREVRVLGGNDRQAVIDGVSGVPVGSRVVVDPQRLRKD